MHLLCARMRMSVGTGALSDTHIDCVPAHTAACVCACRNLFDYDLVVNTQRDRIYSERRRALLSPDLSPLIVEYAEKTSDDIIEVRSEARTQTLNSHAHIP